MARVRIVPVQGGISHSAFLTVFCVFSLRVAGDPGLTAKLAVECLL